MKKFALLLTLSLLFGLAGCSGEKNPTDPKLIKLPAAKLLTLRMQGPYEKMNGAFAKLFAAAGQSDAKAAGKAFAVYYNDPAQTKPENYDWEVCLPVGKNLSPKAPVKFRLRPAGEAVAVLYTGDYGTKAHIGCYTSIMTSVSNMKGYRLSGPPVEEYHEIKGFMGGKKNVTMIYFPVEKK